MTSTAYTTTSTADMAADTSAEDVTTQKKPVFLALVHRYETVKSIQSLTTNQKLYADNFNVEDPQLAKHSLVPFSHMKLSKTAVQMVIQNLSLLILKLFHQQFGRKLTTIIPVTPGF